VENGFDSILHAMKPPRSLRIRGALEVRLDYRHDRLEIRPLKDAPKVLVARGNASIRANASRVHSSAMSQRKSRIGPGSAMLSARPRVPGRVFLAV
jgi:hypothetical protein